MLTKEIQSFQRCAGEHKKKLPRNYTYPTKCFS